MIILKWWIIMNKSLPHFLNGGKCITEGGLQPSCSLSAVRGGVLAWTSLATPPPPSSHACLGTSCKRAVWVRRSQSSSQETLQFTYHIQTASVLSGCHFHSDPPPLHPLLLFGPLAVLNPVFCLVFVVNLQTFSAWAKAQRKTSSFSDDWPLVVMGSTACCSLRTPDLLGNLETRISSNESCSDVEGKQNSRSFLLVVQKN